jgi:hypothetical protein
MKTLVISIALCLPACAQFNFFNALATWKGAAVDTNLLVLHLPLAEASGDAIATTGPDFPITGAIGALSPGRGTFATNNIFSHSDSFAPNMASNSFTILAWYKINSIPLLPPPSILIEAFGTSNSVVLLGPSSDFGNSCEFYMLDSTGAGPGIARDDTVTTNVWHFVVAQYLSSPQTVSLSFNNSSFTNNPFAFTPLAVSGQTFAIGGKPPGTNNLIAGPLDAGYLQHVRVFTRILSAAEITTYYNGGTPN